MVGDKIVSAYINPQKPSRNLIDGGRNESQRRERHNPASDRIFNENNQKRLDKSKVLLYYSNQMRDNHRYVIGFKCPECGSKRLRKAGSAMGKNYKLKRRYHCDNCDLHTVKPVKIK